jgi:hypothetical protein
MVERRVAYRVLVGNLRERDHSEDPGVDGRLLFEWIVKNWGRCMAWIHLALDKGSWRAFINSVMNLWVP